MRRDKREPIGGEERGDWRDAEKEDRKWQSNRQSERQRDSFSGTVLMGWFI